MDTSDTSTSPNRPVMRVSHTSTDVTITVPADLAHTIAGVWAAAHMADPVLAERGPHWHRDVLALVAHAVASEQEAGGGPVPVEAVLLTAPAYRDRPALKAVQS
jgi:hypothetical protein